MMNEYKITMMADDGTDNVCIIVAPDIDVARCLAIDDTAEWLARGDYDPLDSPVEVCGHYAIDDEDKRRICIRITGGDFIDGYDWDIVEST